VNLSLNLKSQEVLNVNFFLIFFFALNTSKGFT